jgi:hypothetical protein
MKRPDPKRIAREMPDGEPLERIARDVLKAVGRWYVQQHGMFARLKELDPLDPTIAGLNMAGRFIPYIDAYIDLGGNVARTELGLLDADDWMVRNPFAIESARSATLALCQETVDNFLGDLDTTLNGIRRDLAQSIERGETAAQGVDRVAAWLDDNSRWRARAIATTESARAFNAGQVASTEDLDFVAGYELLLSADACPLCHAIYRQCPMIPKGGTFGENGKNPKYKNLKFPPFHTRCRCTIVPLFDDEVPASWPKPVKPDANGYIKPAEMDIISAVEGGYESVAIGNAKCVYGFITPWEGSHIEDYG